MEKRKLKDILSQLKNVSSPAERLIKFYELLGWNKENNIDPTKVRLNEEDLEALIKNEMENAKRFGLTAIDVGFLWLNKGPGGDKNIEKGTILLKDGWQL
jgi:hypothetical protein